MDNNTSIDNTLQAILLLCCYFNKNELRNYKPLTPTEYGPFSRWLHDNEFNPADLLKTKNEVLELWKDPKGKVSSERINVLLSRGASMGFALEKWFKSGIWVISRADPAYPRSLKNKLKELSPPVLFGVGNKELLKGTGIGFVGSRSIDSGDEAFTEAKAQLAVSQGFTVVSGGAKGVDQTSMLSALKVHGCSIGVLSDNLFRSSASKAYREHLADHRLVLVSPFYPEAGFNIGNAMARNKYIYSLSKAVVVVKSDLNKGGTWSGAKESLKKGLSVTLIRNASYPGNQELIRCGGNAIDDTFNDFTQEFKIYDAAQQSISNRVRGNTEVEGDLFSVPLDGTQSTEETQPRDIHLVKIGESTDNMDGVDYPDCCNPGSTVESSLVNAIGNRPHSLGDKASESISDSLTKGQQVSDHCQNPSNLDNIETKDTIVCNNPAISNGAISTILPEVDSTISQAADAVKCLPLEEYGALLNLFYQDILQHCQDEKRVSMEDLKKFYPELTAKGIAKWLKILTEKELLIRVGKQHLYQQP